MALGAARLVRWTLAAAAVGLLAPGAAAAERAAGITGNLNLVRFDTTSPSEVSVRSITGLQTATEKAIGLDTRPATGELFLVTTPAGVVSGSSEDPRQASRAALAPTPASSASRGRARPRGSRGGR